MIRGLRQGNHMVIIAGAQDVSARTEAIRILQWLLKRPSGVTVILRTVQKRLDVGIHARIEQFNIRLQQLCQGYQNVELLKEVRTL